MQAAGAKLAAFLTLVGLGLVTFALWHGGNTVWTLAGGGAAVGKVRRVLGSGKAMSTDAVIEFPGPESRPVRILALVDGDLDEGDEVAVRFRPDDPRRARVVSFWSVVLVPLLNLVFGAPLLLIGLALRRKLASTSSGPLVAPNPVPDAFGSTKVPLPGKLLVGFVVLFGLVWLGVGVHGLADWLALARRGQSLTGTVETIRVSHETHRDNKGRASTSTSYYATVRYDDPAGARAASFEQSLYDDQRILEQGDPVDLVFAPGDPPVVAIAGTHVLWRDAIPLLVGLLCLWGARALARVIPVLMRQS